MPSSVYEMAYTYWIAALTSSLKVLADPNAGGDPGYMLFGASTFRLDPGKSKQSDSAIGFCAAPESPTVVLEIGNSESLTQLKIDAMGWLESENFKFYSS